MEQENVKIEVEQSNQSLDASKINDTKFALAMLYVPPQEWEDLYDADIGFHRGTIFQQLDKPFIGEEAVPRDRT